MAAYGTVVALLERERSGEGQWVHTSLLQAMMRLMDLQAARWLQGGEVPPQAGNYHPVGAPTGVYKCRDGSIIIQAAGRRLYDPLCSRSSRRRSWSTTRASPRAPRPASSIARR